LKTFLIYSTALNAGTSFNKCKLLNFFGVDTGYSATSANNSNFIGQAGYSATSASNSNFIGYQLVIMQQVLITQISLVIKLE
jgi:hypothetical protein